MASGPRPGASAGVPVGNVTPARRRDAGDPPGRAGVDEVVPDVRVDVAEASAGFGAPEALAPGLHQGHEQRDLAAPEHAERPEEVLLEVGLARPRRGGDVVAAAVERAGHETRLRLHPDERVLEHPQPTGCHGPRPRAAGLRPGRRREGQHDQPGRGRFEADGACGASRESGTWG